MRKSQIMRGLREVEAVPFSSMYVGQTKTIIDFFDLFTGHLLKRDLEEKGSLKKFKTFDLAFLFAEVLRDD